MAYPDHAFRHTPALRGKIIPPEESGVRLSYERFDELDAEAAAEGREPGWRMEHGAREANRRAVLAGRMDRDLWVFAYGSLIWDPAVYLDEIRRATLEGWHRSFCMKLDGGRATPEVPGLMAALDEGGRCEGTALRIPAALVDCETERMWMREMFSGAYRPIFVPVSTPQGPLEALTFVMDHANERYVPELPVADAARMIARAEGRLGPNFDYLDNLVRHLDELGIRDDAIHDLYAQTIVVRETANQAGNSAS